MTLSACGSESGSVTYAATLEPFNETLSLQALQHQLEERRITVLKFQCGFFDMAKLPISQRGGFVGGRTPRVVYLTIADSDVETASSVPFPSFAPMIDPAKSVHSDPFDCDPTDPENWPPPT